MANQPTLLPSLLALHPAATLPLLLSRLSLQALHIEPYLIQDDVFVATTSVLPGQMRNLRLRARRMLEHGAPRHGRKGKERESEGEWEYTLTYLSPPLSGQEYSEMSVRACIALEVAGMSSRREIEGFIEALGFRHSHSYTRSGYLVHLPLPLFSPTPFTLHLTLTRLGHSLSGSGTAKGNESNSFVKPPDRTSTSEPYLLALQPSRPVQPVSPRGEPGLEDMMRVMRDVGDRLEGVVWESGRP